MLDRDAAILATATHLRNGHPRDVTLSYSMPRFSRLEAYAAAKRSEQLGDDAAEALMTLAQRRGWPLRSLPPLLLLLPDNVLDILRVHPAEELSDE